MKRAVLLILLALAALCAPARAEEFHVIPFDVDPPIAVDANLDDWAGVPNAIALATKEQVAYGVDKWTGPADLSATVRLAYRYDGLYIAAEVADDAVHQPYQGGDVWKADHIEVFMDFTPQQDPKRTMFGDGQFQIGLSPGGFGVAGAGGVVPQPEIHVWRPKNASQEGGKIASRKTDTGYVIEAYVPFTRLRIPAVRMNQDANFEICVSDTDSAESKQETMIMRGTAPWRYSRDRLLPMVFGNGNGEGAAPARTKPIQGKAEVLGAQKLTIAFNVDALPEGKAPYLFFQARFDMKKVAGFRAGSLAANLNGQRIKGDRLTNRPQVSMWMSGKESTFVANDGRMTVPYAPSAKVFDSDPNYALVNNVKGCDFEFNLTGLLKTGENTLVFENFWAPTEKYPYTVTLENIELRIKAQGVSANALAPAPTGALPFHAPANAFSKRYADLTRKAGAIAFTLNGEPFAVQSSFTAPDGKTYNGASPFYGHTREVVEHDEWIEVRDTFVNTTKDNVPIMQTHTCAPGPQRARAVYLACVRMPAGSGSKAEPANPSAVVSTAKNSVGLLALNDVFRVHSAQSAANGAVALSDRAFVLKPGATYTAEWAIVPVAGTNVWDFVNASRRLLDANFPLTIQSGWMCHRDPVYEWSDELFKSFVERKSLNMALQSIYFARWKGGRLPQGLAFNRLSEHYDYYRDFRKKLDRLFPDGSVRHGVYFHCYLDVMDENVETFRGDHCVNAAGEHVSYSGTHPYLKHYIPTLENGWGKAVAAGVDVRLNDLNCNGFYWDEFNESCSRYTYNLWDGCSADINAKSFRIERVKGSVHLLSLPWLVEQVKKIRGRNVPLILNGAPHSRTIANLKIQNFTETGSITNCHRTILHSPVALGDHLTERSQKDCYSVMLRALDWGCLYNWYSGVIPTHATITEHMFPATPIELHEGYILCKERILTNRSGNFGWGDRSGFAIHVYDREGRATDGKEARAFEKDGRTWAEIRIPEGYSAAIVRAQ